MAKLRDTLENQYPHVIQEPGRGPEQARVLGTGMHAWEIVWVADKYPDLSAMADSLNVDRDLLEEGIRYAAEHPSEVATAIDHIDSVTREDLQTLLPGMKIVTPDPDTPSYPPS